MKKLLALAVLAAGGSFWLAGSAAQGPAAPGRGAASRPTPVRPGEPVTIFAISDTHVGGADTAGRNPRLIQLLNALPGQAWPGALGGTVAAPTAVIACGDLTNSGTAPEWKQFGELFLGKPGGGDPLPAPLLECTGNHDRDLNRRVVPDAVRKRHGDLLYTTDLGGATAVCLDSMLVGGWLKRLHNMLADIPMDRPLVIYLHYPVAPGGFRTGRDKLLLDALAGRRVAAILHGHLHGFGYHELEGIPVVNLPTVRGDRPGVAVLRISPTRVDIACHALEKDGWFFHKSLPLPAPVAKDRPATVPASRPATQPAP